MNETHDILVIDDERDICELVRDILARSGYSAYAAAGPEEALTYLEHHTPPVIITDISMPRKTGLELVTELRLRGLQSAFVILTAHSEKEMIVEALRLGCIDYILKPFDPRHIVHSVDLWLKIGQDLQGLAHTGTLIEKKLSSIDVIRAKANAVKKKLESA